jgi:hypothetical protein
LTAFLCVIGALMVLTFLSRFPALKFRCCFATDYNIVWVAALMAACFYVSRDEARDALLRMHPVGLWLLLPGLSLLSAAIGKRYFELKSFYHGLGGVSALGWLPIVQDNFWRTAIPTVVALVACFPWRNTSKNRVLAWFEIGAGLVLLNYLIAFMGYAAFGRFEEQ